MKFLLSIAVLTIFLVPAVYAAEINCYGKVGMLMADHPSCVDGAGKRQLAFKLEGTSPWLCNGSDAASSLVLSAKMADKNLSVYISDADGATCGAHANYLKPKYTIIP